LTSGIQKIEVFLVSYACLIVSTVVVMSYLNVGQVDIYIAGFAIEYFIVILATSPYNPEESRRQRVIGVMLLVIFTGIVIERVLQLLM
jgi:uncharacterized membrane protein YczE